MDQDIRPNQQENKAKPKLLIFPGMVCNARSWLAQCEALAEYVECQIVDYAQHHSFIDMAEHALSQCEGEFMAVGHSMGGRVAMEVFNLAPQRVQGMCLISTEHLAAPTGEKGQSESSNREKLLQIAEQQSMLDMAKSWLPHLIPVTSQSNTALTSEIISMIAEHSPEQLQAHISAGSKRTDSTDILTNLNVPTLLIVGDQDAIRPVQVHQQMLELVSDGTLLVLENVGHMPTMEASQQVNSALSQWVKACQDQCDHK